MQANSPQSALRLVEAGRSWTSAFARGARKKCPRCGDGALFAAYTKTAERCAACGLDFSGHRADDAPPYVAMMIVGHVTIPLVLVTKQLFDPPMLAQFALWLPLILALTIWILPRTKGALIGVQWANHMHGFDDAPENEASPK